MVWYDIVEENYMLSCKVHVRLKVQVTVESANHKKCYTRRSQLKVQVTMICHLAKCRSKYISFSSSNLSIQFSTCTILWCGIVQQVQFCYRHYFMAWYGAIHSSVQFATCTLYLYTLNL